MGKLRQRSLISSHDMTAHLHLPVAFCVYSIKFISIVELLLFHLFTSIMLLPCEQVKTFSFLQSITHVLPCGHPLFSVFMWKSRGWLQCKGAICIHKEAGLNSVMHIKQRMSMHWLVMSTCPPHPVFYLSYYYVFGLKTLVLKQEALIKSYFCVAKKCSKIALVSDVPIQWSGRAFIN